MVSLPVRISSDAYSNNKIALAFGLVLSMAIISIYTKRSSDSTAVSATNTIDTTHAIDKTQPPSPHVSATPERKRSQDEYFFYTALQYASNTNASSPYLRFMLTNYQTVNGMLPSLQGLPNENSVNNMVFEKFNMTPSDFRIIYINNNTINTLLRILIDTEQYGGNLDIDDGNKTTPDTKLIFIGVKDMHKEKMKEFQEPHFTTTIEGDTYHIL